LFYQVVIILIRRGFFMIDRISLDACFDRFVKGELGEYQLETMLTRYLGNSCGISPRSPAGTGGQARCLGKFCATILRAAANCRQGIYPDTAAG
jgi:hypothetical protein